MNTFLKKIASAPKMVFLYLRSLFMELPRTQKIITSVIGVLILGIVVHAFSSSAAQEEVLKTPREVKLALVSSLSNNNGSIPLIGTVTSLSEATIRTESSGKLTRVYKKLGDYVGAGEVIAEFENSGERAAVLQAEGVYDAAKASRDIAKINSGTTNSSLLDTKTSVLNTISTAYTTMDDAVRVKTDTAFSNPRNVEATLLITIPDANLKYTLESERKAVEKILLAREVKNRTLSIDSDLLSELNAILQETKTVKAYLDDLASAYAKAIPDSSYSQTTLATNQTTLGLARSAINGSITSIISSKTALSTSIGAQEIAGKTASDGTASTATADAVVKQAEGAYNAALSRLQKTIIRSPISGTLNSLSIETGDFVTQFSEVAVVSNNGALEVLSYVTEDDARRIPAGSTVLINSTTKGIVTRIASALNPLTKKIEVRIGIVDKGSTLINGQSVRVDVTSTTAKTKTSTDIITIPLSAIKITPKGSYVFTVEGPSNTLISIPVTIGTILGDKIQILSGITNDTRIVIDARGLKDDTEVSVKE